MFVWGWSGGRDTGGKQGSTGVWDAGCKPVILLSLDDGTKHLCSHPGRLVCPPRSLLGTLFHQGHSFHLLLPHTGRVFYQKGAWLLGSISTNINANLCHCEHHMPVPLPWQILGCAATVPPTWHGHLPPPAHLILLHFIYPGLVSPFLHPLGPLPSPLSMNNSECGWVDSSLH